MTLFSMTLKSIFSRKVTTILLILSIGLSSMLLMGVQKIKQSAKESFSHSISGTDLIVGARAGELQLLMYTLFRQGQPVANISWKSIQAIQAFDEVDWVVPFSLGDSHKGYAVLGTTSDYFTHYRYGKKKSLSIKKGHLFKHYTDVVLGSDVAKKLSYELGDSLFLSHGMAKGSLSLHKNKSFKVVGILKPTGTPVDNTVHVKLEAITALHNDPAQIAQSDKAALQPTSVTSCLVGLTSKFSIFTVQRRLANWKQEPLMAIIPGVSLARLWNSFSTIDAAFLVMTILVTLITFMGLLLALFMSLQQRHRELAILRTLGAHPIQLAMMLMLESCLITSSGVLLGIGLIGILNSAVSPILEESFGLIMSVSMVSFTDLIIVIGIMLCGLLTSCIPAMLAYRKGLSERFVSL
ncbi:peptide ABC transporter permease [Candidatus Marinamargulisbacteria bacterium SCGC AG-414-C22]|nr:peptide ABC transporter permease [Candidatus Marinamargulisbacteria bacterium SCGC AG-414-C22]